MIIILMPRRKKSTGIKKPSKSVQEMYNPVQRTPVVSSAPPVAIPVQPDICSNQKDTRTGKKLQNQKTVYISMPNALWVCYDMRGLIDYISNAPRYVELVNGKPNPMRSYIPLPDNALYVSKESIGDLLAKIRSHRAYVARLHSDNIQIQNLSSMEIVVTSVFDLVPLTKPGMPEAESLPTYAKVTGALATAGTIAYTGWKNRKKALELYRGLVLPMATAFRAVANKILRKFRDHPAGRAAYDRYMYDALRQHLQDILQRMVDDQQFTMHNLITRLDEMIANEQNAVMDYEYFKNIIAHLEVLGAQSRDHFQSSIQLIEETAQSIRNREENDVARGEQLNLVRLAQQDAFTIFTEVQQAYSRRIEFLRIPMRLLGPEEQARVQRLIQEELDIYTEEILQDRRLIAQLKQINREFSVSRDQLREENRSLYAVNRALVSKLDRDVIESLPEDVRKAVQDMEPLELGLKRLRGQMNAFQSAIDQVELKKQASIPNQAAIFEGQRKVLELSGELSKTMTRYEDQVAAWEQYLVQARDEVQVEEQKGENIGSFKQHLGDILQTIEMYTREFASLRGTFTNLITNLGGNLDVLQRLEWSDPDPQNAMMDIEVVQDHPEATNGEILSFQNRFT